MPHAIEENPLTKLPYALWATARPGSDTPASAASAGGGVRLPRTIVFEYNFPKALYFTPRAHGAGAEEDEMLTGASPKDGAAMTVQRIAGKDIDSRAVVELMCPPAAAKKRRAAKRDLPASSTGDAALDFQAMYACLNINPPSASSDGGGGGSDGAESETGVTHHVATQYLSPLGLKYFMQGASVLSTPSSGAGSNGSQHQPQRSGASTATTDAVVRRITAEVKLIDAKDGILQWMPPSGCPHSEVIEAVWTRHMLVCEKLRNVHLVKDHALSNFDRAATFDGPPNMSTRKFVAPAIQDGIRGQIHDALRRVAAFVPGQRVVDATMYFRVDAVGELWLMFCTRLKLGALPSPESAPSVRADRIAKAIAKHTASDTGGFVQTGPRPLSLVEFSESDVQRDFMLRQMTSAAEALGKASGDKQAARENGGAGTGEGSRRSSSSAALARPGSSSAMSKGAGRAPKNAPVPFAVPAESKMVLLTGLTRRGTKYAKNTPWNQLAATNLAVESGIAQVRTRGEFDRIALDAPCFRPKPIEARCLDRDGNAPQLGTATRSALAKPMRWLKDPDIELTAHRYSSTLGSKSRQPLGQARQTPTLMSVAGSPHDSTLRSNRGTPQKSSRRPDDEAAPAASVPPSPKGIAGRTAKRASIMLPDPLAGESGDDEAGEGVGYTARAAAAVDRAAKNVVRPVDVDAFGSLVLSNGAQVVSREMAPYFKQKVRTEEQLDADTKALQVRMGRAHRAVIGVPQGLRSMPEKERKAEVRARRARAKAQNKWNEQVGVRNSNLFVVRPDVLC